MIPLVNVENKVDSAHLAVDHTTDTLIIWGNEHTRQTGCVFDIKNNKQFISIENKSYDPTSVCTPYFMSKNELFVLNSENGSFDLYDLTSGRHLVNINLPGNSMFTIINLC